jgi:putative transposon-encoded protein
MTRTGRVGTLLTLLAVLATAALAADSPVTYHNCRMASYPLLIIDEVEYGPGVYGDTVEVELGEVLSVYVEIGVDDSSGSPGAYKCECDSILASEEWSKYRVDVAIDQPSPPDYDYDWTTIIRTITECPAMYQMESYTFRREGVGSIMAKVRILQDDLDYLAPLPDSAVVYFKVVHTPMGTGARAMVPK